MPAATPRTAGAGAPGRVIAAGPEAAEDVTGVARRRRQAGRESGLYKRAGTRFALSVIRNQGESGMMPRSEAGPRPALRLAALCLVAACLAPAGGCQREGGRGEVRVVTSTTMLEAIVREIGRDRVSAAALIPAGTGPEDFDIPAEGLERAAAADLVILSGWEKWAGRVGEAVHDPRRIALTGVHADLMLPHYHLEAADSVTEALVRADPGWEVFYRYNRGDYRSRVAAEVDRVCASLAAAGPARVICAEPQAELLAWMGFDIIGTYAPFRGPSEGEIARLVDVGRRHGARLVVDDAHAPQEAGKRIAAGLGVPRVVLTAYPDRGSYIDLLGSNAARLVSALD